MPGCTILDASGFHFISLQVPVILSKNNFNILNAHLMLR